MQGGENMEPYMLEWAKALFGSGWPVAAMLLVFGLLDRRKFALGREVAERDVTITELKARCAKLEAEKEVIASFWMNRADAGSVQVQSQMKILERAVDALEEQTAALIRKVS